MHVGHNDPCPCGSGKLYKDCCLAQDTGIEPQQPDGVIYTSLWDELQAVEPAEMPALFRRALNQIQLDDDFLYELLAALRDSDQRPMAGALLNELRTARPDIYAQSAPYYLEWQICDAITMGEDDQLPELTMTLAHTAGEELDLFSASRDRLAYHGYLNLIAPMMREAWPLVRASEKFVPGAAATFAADGQQFTFLDYIAMHPAPYAKDPELITALAFFGSVHTEKINEQLHLLTGAEAYPWRGTGYTEDEQIQRLALSFQGELARTGNIPLSRGELARIALVNYIFERREQNPPPPQATALERATHLLCPDRASLDHYLAHLLNLISYRLYHAAALLEVTPAWLQFLQDQQLITATQRANTLTDLHKLVSDAEPIWEQYRSDIFVAQMIRDAWERTG